MVTTLRTEGWCTDPYGRHEARWISEGTPTHLVRDGSNESIDLPSGQPTGQAIPISWGEQTPHGADLLRSDQRVPEGSQLFERVAGIVLSGGSD